MLVRDSEVVGKAKRRKLARKKKQGIWGERGCGRKKIGPILPDPSLVPMDYLYSPVPVILERQTG